jgi:hypothetical protein
VLDVSEVIVLLGDALEQFTNTARHTKRRATPAQTWTTPLEATSVNAVRTVLETAWKWDGIRWQPDRGCDGSGFGSLLALGVQDLRHYCRAAGFTVSAHRPPVGSSSLEGPVAEVSYVT